MKQLFLLAIFLPFFSFAQSDKYKFYDKLLVNFYHANFLHHNNALNVKWYSRGIDLFYMQPFSIDKKYFSIALGGGISTQSYANNAYLKELTHPDTALKTSTFTSFLAYADADKPKRNKLTTTYFEFPIEFRFQSAEDNHGNKIKASIGAKAGYLLDMHTRMVNSNGKYKSYIFPNREKWKYSAIVRVGYDRIQLYGSYSFNGLFKDNFGDSTNPIALGFTYTLY